MPATPMGLGSEKSGSPRVLESAAMTVINPVTAIPSQSTGRQRWLTGVPSGKRSGVKKSTRASVGYQYHSASQAAGINAGASTIPASNA